MLSNNVRIYENKTFLQTFHKENIIKILNNVHKKDKRNILLYCFLYLLILIGIHKQAMHLIK